MVSVNVKQLTFHVCGGKKGSNVKHTVYFKGTLPALIIALNRAFKCENVLPVNCCFEAFKWMRSALRPLQLTYRRVTGKMSTGINKGDAAEGLFIQDYMCSYICLYTHTLNQTSTLQIDI